MSIEHQEPELELAEQKVDGDITYGKAIRPDMVTLWEEVGRIWNEHPGIDPRNPKAAATLQGELNMAHARALASSTLERSRLEAITPTTLLALFRLYPALGLRAQEYDPTEAAYSPPIEQLEEIEFRDFVGALSVAAIANWIPYRGTGGRLGIRVHMLSDPSLVRELA